LVETVTSLKSLLLISVLALAVPMALHRLSYLRLPVVVGEIVCGIIIGRSGLGLIDHQDSLLNLLALLGFTYLMFLGGMEIDISVLTGAGRRLSGRQRGLLGAPPALGVIMFGLTLVMSYFSCRYMLAAGILSPPTNALMLALVLSTTSVGVVLPILKESRSTDTAYGQTLLTGAVVADILTILLATAAILLFSRGGRGAVLAALVALILGFFVVYRAGLSFVALPRIRRLYTELSHSSAQILVRTAFALMLLFTMMSQVVGVEIVLGAFLAGLMFRVLFHNEGLANEMKFDAIGYGFLIPVFFIMVGVRLDLDTVIANPGAAGLMVLLLVVAFAAKVLPSLILVPQFGLRNSLAGGLLLNSRLSLIIAFSEVAVGAGMMQPELEAVTILIALVSCLAAPVSFMGIQTEGEEQAGIGVMILGAGKVGRTLAMRLQDRKHCVWLLDIDGEAVEKASAEGLKTYHYTELDEETLRSGMVEDASIFVAVTGTDAVNMEACLLAHQKFGVKTLVARVGNPANVPAFVQHGIRPMTESMASVVALENIMYRPTVYSLLAHEQEGMEILEVEARNPRVFGRRLMNIALPGNALVLLVKKDEETSIPHGNTRIDEGDVVTLFVGEDAKMEIARVFDPGRPDLHAGRPGGMS